ncbi:methyltransferase [Streptomyces zhaozhouensis]|uniref:methyltransferase n=1 Tax=Streptomyces zhaozhouensis TaxID=1300267 RepID=UPI00114304FA|nr:methyltransferase [Streptomyces zhaozhouensis]
MTSESVTEEPDVRAVLRLAYGGQFAKALAEAVRLGLPDLAGDDFVPVADLAAATGTRREVLDALLRTLALAGTFAPDGAGGYRLSAPFAPLRADHPRSVRNMCVLMAGPYTDAFNGLGRTLTGGESGFRGVHGADLYPYLTEHPETAAVFDAAMAELCRPTAHALAGAYDFGEVRRVVDVGGGDGTLLDALLTHAPWLEGVCLDRPPVCARAAARPHAAGARLTFRPADVFAEVPADGDRFLLKNVLHDWSPDLQLRLLENVRAALARTEGARLLVLEPLFEGEEGAAHALAQMVICHDGSRPFTAAALRALFDRAGLAPLRTERLACGHHLFECVATSRPQGRPGPRERSAGQSAQAGQTPR